DQAPELSLAQKCGVRRFHDPNPDSGLAPGHIHACDLARIAMTVLDVGRESPSRVQPGWIGESVHVNLDRRKRRVRTEMAAGAGYGHVIRGGRRGDGEHQPGYEDWSDPGAHEGR